MMSHRLSTPGITQQNLREPRQHPRPSARRPSRARLAMETLEPRALLTASPNFASCAWMEALPESVWMATCHAATSTASCPSTVAEVTQDGTTECSDTVKTVSVRGGSSTVCVDSKTECPVQDGKTGEQECAPKECKTARSSDPTSTCESKTTESKTTWESGKPNCQQQPIPEQLRQAAQEKVAALLRQIGYDCNVDKHSSRTGNCDPVEKSATVKSSGSSCDSNQPRNCRGPQSESQGQGCYPDKAEIGRIVDRCFSDTSWNASTTRLRSR
jgi:hypothetical protein